MIRGRYQTLTLKVHNGKRFEKIVSIYTVICSTGTNCENSYGDLFYWDKLGKALALLR